MKLLDEPRVPSKLSLPKNSRNAKGEDPRGKPKFTILCEDAAKKVKMMRFVELYKEDKLAARVKYFNRSNNYRTYNEERYSYDFTRVVAFEWDNGDFSVNHIINRVGISTSGKMYSTSKTIEAYIFKDGKYWFRSGNGVKPLNYANTTSFGYTSPKIEEFLKQKIQFFETISEFPWNSQITFNTIVREKLFGLNDLYRFYFKVPINIAKILAKVKFKNNHFRHKYQLTRYRSVLKNVQNLTEELATWAHFGDALDMALTLGEKINCGWGLKRIKEEHDKWSRKIANMLLKSEPERDLRIRKDLAGFGEFSGYRLLKTNRDMLYEGLRQDHCVGTYISSVENGECAIFDVENYTLQLKIKIEEDSLGIKYKKCYNAQYLGYKNSHPPLELVGKVNAMIEAYNESELFKSFDEEQETDIITTNNVAIRANDVDWCDLPI